MNEAMNKKLHEMTETERAEFYEQHQDDDSLFSHEPEAVAIGKTSTTFSLRISGAELTRISAAARTRGMNVSEFIRKASLAAADDEAEESRAITIGEAKQKARDLAETLKRL